ncbi:hypothetical protein WKW80_05775 [Variovorax humicola]|uniref:Uncharacterized protein n=1 Tax=Variovorax humicola TaxID=1769758 RepID=A0ABU8VUQ4_9BURK
MKRLRMITFASTIAASAVGASAQTGPDATFSLKGYALGADMASCPAGFTTRKSGAKTLCGSPSQTLAGQPVEVFLINLYRGKVIGVAAAGVENPRDVTQALVSKFGEPTTSNPEANEYAWTRGGHALVVKPYSSTTAIVAVKDFAAYDAVKAEDAKDL